MTMTETERYRILERRYNRLLVAAENVVREARAIGNSETPMCSVPPNRIRILRREVAGEPQPSALATMSAS
jgi:hypothetical protein